MDRTFTKKMVSAAIEKTDDLFVIKYYDFGNGVAWLDSTLYANKQLAESQLKQNGFK